MQKRKSITRRVNRMFATRLRKLRCERGFCSAESFARSIDLDAPTYRRYERAEAQPSLETLAKICIALDVTPNDVLPVPTDIWRHDGTPAVA